MQSEDIPRIEKWAQRTGSSFAAEKTELIHLARKRGEHLEGQLTFDGTDVKPPPTAKLLGVMFDQELRWKEQAQQAMKCATYRFEWATAFASRTDAIALASMRDTMHRQSGMTPFGTRPTSDN